MRAIRATADCIQRVANEAIRHAKGEVFRQAIGENITGIEHLVFDGAASKFVHSRLEGKNAERCFAVINKQCARSGGVV